MGIVKNTGSHDLALILPPEGLSELYPFSVVMESHLSLTVPRGCGFLLCLIPFCGNMKKMIGMEEIINMKIGERAR